MDAYVFDTSSLIDLFKENILEEILDVIQSDKLYISDENFEEIKNRGLEKIVKDKIDIYPSDNDEFVKLREGWKNKRITGGFNDLHVVYVIEKIYNKITSFGKVYAVSFDDGLIRTLYNYKKTFNKNILKVWTTINMLDLAYIEKTLTYPEYIEKSLHMFKFNEIEKYFKNLKTYNKKTHQKDLKDTESLLRQRFQIYKLHLKTISQQFINTHGIEING